MDYEWQESPYGPPRKYYRLTDAGKSVLAALNESWNALAGTVDKIRNVGK